MQGVLNYEKRLVQALDELRLEKGKHRGTLNQVEFWCCHAQYLEAKLKVIIQLTCREHMHK